MPEEGRENIFLFCVFYESYGSTSHLHSFWERRSVTHGIDWSGLEENQLKANKPIGELGMWNYNQEQEATSEKG